MSFVRSALASVPKRRPNGAVEAEESSETAHARARARALSLSHELRFSGLLCGGLWPRVWTVDS